MASKGRNITSAVIGCGHVYADGRMVNLNELSRTELAKAYAQAFQGKDSGFPLNLTNAEFINAIVTGVVPESAHRERGIMTGEPTTKQRNFIRGLGGDPWAPTTKQEAAQMIKRLIDEKEKREGKNEWGVKPPTPVYMPPTPSPTPTPTPAIDKHLQRSIDDLADDVRTMATSQMEAINRLSDKIGDHDVTLGSLALSVDSLTSRVNDLEKNAPKVIEVVIKEQPKVEFDGNTVHYLFPDVVRAVASGVNVMLVGPAGTGKTTLCRQVAEAMNMLFGFQGFHLTMDPSELLGYRNAMGENVTTEFSELYGAEKALFLFDETDAINPGCALAVNAAIDNGYCSFPWGTVKKGEGVRFIGGANTYGSGADSEYVGRLQQDAAFLNRWAILDMDYDTDMEYRIAHSILDSTLTDEWIALVYKYRENQRKHSIREIFGTRNLVQGCKLLAGGFDIDKAEKMTLVKGISGDTLSKLQGAW